MQCVCHWYVSITVRVSFQCVIRNSLTFYSSRQAAVYVKMLANKTQSVPSLNTWSHLRMRIVFFFFVRQQLLDQAWSPRAGGPVFI